MTTNPPLTDQTQQIHTIPQLLQHLTAMGANPHKIGPNEYMARCPLHDDNTPSLNIRPGTTQPLLLHCFACQNNTPQWIAQALDKIQLGQQMPEARPTNTTKNRRAFNPKPHNIVATYDYPPTHRKHRHESPTGLDKTAKTFTWQHLDTAGIWQPRLAPDTKQTDLPPYRSEHLKDGPLIIVEGEKDADRLATLGLNVISTLNGQPPNPTNPTTKQLHLDDRELKLIVDNDPTGRQHAHQWLTTHPHTQIFRTPLTTIGADVSDHLDAGLPLEDLLDVTNTANKDHTTNQLPTNGTPPTKWDDNQYWESHPLLKWSRDAGRSRRSSPSSVLGTILARISSETSPHLVIPPLVGSVASLNFGTITVGQSGQGKSSSVSLVRDNPPDPTLGWHATDTSAASGEALGAAFAYSRKHNGAKQLHWHSVHSLVYYDEIGGLEQAANRSGSTLTSDIRSAISGQSFGRNTIGEHSGIRIGPHQVSLAVIVAAQATKTGWLLAEGDSGTPQRFLWVRNVDPQAPRRREDLPPFPGPPPISPTLLCDGGCLDEDADPITPRHTPLTELQLPTAVEQLVDDVRYAGLLGQVSVLDGHLTLTTIKVASLLAISEGTATVTLTHWAIAEQIILRSQEVMAHCQAEVTAVMDQAIQTAGKQDANRATARDNTHAVNAQARALTANPQLSQCQDPSLTPGLAAMLAHRDRVHPGKTQCSRKCLRASLRRHRDDFDQLISEATTLNILTVEVVPGAKKSHTDRTNYEWGAFP